MLDDRYGNGLTTSSAAARDAYVLGVDRFLAADSGVNEAFSAAIAEDGNFALAYAGLARSQQTLGQVAGAAKSIAEAQANAGDATGREASHIAALGLLIGGQGPAAYQAIRTHLADYPRDAMAAQPCMGVFGLIGFSGQAGREAEHLAFTTALAPHYGDDWWFLAQHAFAQMEAGQIAPAEATIERALDGNPRNANAAHFRSHLYYENGETGAGYTYLDEWRRGYDKSALLHCHISWHIALWALEQGHIEKMWQVIDADIDPAGAWGPSLNVLSDMAAILYRAELKGVEVPAERWRVVSDYAARSFPQPGIAFADVHAALAHAMAGNSTALARIIGDAKGPAASVVQVLAQAFGAIAGGNWQEATNQLAKVMADHERIGGSRAQRDLIEHAMIAALLKQGRAGEANLLLTIRRPHAILH